MEIHNSSYISFPDIISLNRNKTLVTNHIRNIRIRLQIKQIVYML